jgi:hypothetical protein
MFFFLCRFSLPFTGGFHAYQIFNTVHRVDLQFSLPIYVAAIRFFSIFFPVVRLFEPLFEHLSLPQLYVSVDLVVGSARIGGCMRLTALPFGH